MPLCFFAAAFVVVTVYWQLKAFLCTVFYCFTLVPDPDFINLYLKIYNSVKNI